MSAVAFSLTALTAGQAKPPYQSLRCKKPGAFRYSKPPTDLAGLAPILEACLGGGQARLDGPLRNSGYCGIVNGAYLRQYITAIA